MIKYFFRLIQYKFFYRVNNQYISFFSFNGKYADSPKFLTEEIHKKAPDKKIIWHVHDVENRDIPEYVKVVKYGTHESWKNYSKSKVIIDNVYGMHECYKKSNSIIHTIEFKISKFLKKKKKQKVYSTWHGTPLKKIGIDANNNQCVDFECYNTTMIIDSTYFEKIMKRITFGKTRVEVLGSPKVDFLLQNEENIKKVKEKLNLPVDKKIVLYAPSFRSNNSEKDIERSGINQLNMININILTKTLNEKFGGEWILVCRFHYHVESRINWNELKEKYGDKIINGNVHEDIAEYLKCSDLLLTDMSSCLFDFSLYKKPIFLFFPDFTHYKDIERGLYMDIEELPFDLSVDFNSLLKNIKDYDNKKIKKVEKFMSSLGYVNVGCSLKPIVNFIMEDAYRETNNK